MKRNAIKTVAALMTSAVIMGSLCSCKYETPATTTTLAPGETTAPTVDLSDQSFETAYGSQLIGYLDHQYYFNGEAIPMAESNFYFIDAFNELSNYATYYGLYPVTAEGWIDLSAPVTSDIETASAEVSGDASEYANYGEFLIKYAERMLESTYIIKTLAAEQGLELSDEELADIDSIMETLATTSSQANMTPEEYLQLYYGPNCTEESFRTIIYNYKVAELYTQDFIDNYEYDESEIMVPNTRYALFWAPEEESDEETTAEQEALAQELYDQCIDPTTGELSLDLFDVYGTFSYTNFQNGDPGAYQYGKEFAVSRGACVQAYEDWAFAEDRAEGDIEVIYAPEYGYFVVGYLGTTEVDQSLKDQIAVDAMSEYILGIIDEGTYEFYTDMEFVAATPVETTAPTGASETSGIGLTAETSQNALKTKDIIMTVLAAVGGIAIIAMIIMAVSNAFKKPQAPVEDDDEDDDESDVPVSDEEIIKELEELNKDSESAEGEVGEKS